MVGSELIWLIKNYLSGKRIVANEVHQKVPSTASTSSVGTPMEASLVTRTPVVGWFLHRPPSKVALEVLCIVSWLGEEAKHTVHDTRHRRPGSIVELIRLTHISLLLFARPFLFAGDYFLLVRFLLVRQCWKVDSMVIVLLFLLGWHCRAFQFR